MPVTGSVLEVARVDLWLKSVLTPLAAGGAWRSRAPDGAAEPFIVYSVYPGGLGDVGGVGAHRIWNESYWLVKAVGQVNATHPTQPIITVADAIDARLQLVGAPGSPAEVISDCRILLCLRMEADLLDEESAGTVVLNARSFWKIRAQHT